MNILCPCCGGNTYLKYHVNGQEIRRCKEIISNGKVIKYSCGWFYVKKMQR